jgi:hypothetical protein
MPLESRTWKNRNSKERAEVVSQAINALIFLAIGLTYYLVGGDAFYVPILVLFGFLNVIWPLFIKSP